MTETVEEISKIIIDTLLENPKVPKNISPDSKIIEDLEFDSLAVMNFRSFGSPDRRKNDS